MTTPQHAPDTLHGVLERLTYHNEENGYTVARLAVEGAQDLITLVGSFSSPVVGEGLVCEGRWVAHREFGRQFQVENYTVTRPSTAFAIEKYLGSGLIKGIGPVMARRMVELFGTDTLDVIENDTRKLLRVQGIGEQRVQTIQKTWQEQREIRNVMLFLQEKGVSSLFAVKLYKAYGSSALSVVQQNPYQLIEDIRGIGFKTADRIAQQLGMEMHHPQRLRAGLLHTLSEATDFGHMYLPEARLVQSAVKKLEVEENMLTAVLAQMIEAQEIIADMLPAPAESDSCSFAEAVDPPTAARALYHPALYYSEAGLASQIKNRLALPEEQKINLQKVHEWLNLKEKQTGFTLSEEQKQAVLLALQHRVLVLTGGPGTGKTSVTNLIARAFEARRKQILQVSPTGRAAKRLAEVTGREAQTIHRCLHYDPARRQFEHNEENPLQCDVLIADEVSMLDSVLAHQLLKAVPKHAQIVLVGDSDQLPSVGAGQVLHDLLASETVPAVRLTQVFRQAEKSLIVTNAHRIRQGELPVLVPPVLPEREGKNMLFIEVEEGENAAAQVVKLVQRVLPALGYAPDDIQTLTAMRRGALGVDSLNYLLQEALNPIREPQLELLRGSRRFRTGDRVIQIVNNYQREVFNGDMGRISAISQEQQTIEVCFGDQKVLYDFADYDELETAYALSIHKSQGSEYRAVVLALHSSQYMMLQRNLFYTGLTRARELCILVADRAAVTRSVRNNKSTRRYTRLAERLQEKAGG